MIAHSLFLSSSYAVKRGEDGIETLIPADAQGVISALTGDVLVFKGLNNQNISVTEIMFKTGENPLMLVINGNARYVYAVPAGSMQGISGLAIYTIRLLNDCEFSYDALA